MSSLYVLALLVGLELPAQAGSEVGSPLPPPTRAADPDRWAGADAEMERVARAAELAAEQGDPLALARLYQLTNEGTVLERPARLDAALEKIRRAPNADALTRAHAAHRLAEALESRGQLAESDAILAELGLLRDALILGPFQNTGGSGHQERHPPETRIDLEAAVPGKDRAVRWHSIGASAARGVVHPAALLHGAADATAYLLFAVEAAGETRAALRTGSSDALKVFLNGAPVLDVDHLRGAHLDQDTVPVVLPAGVSVVLVKSSWRGRDARLLLRFSAPDGGPLGGVRLAGDRASIARALARGARPVKPARHACATATDAIERAMKSATGDALADALALRSNLFAVLELYDARKLPSPPVVDLDRAIRAAPGKPRLRFFYAIRTERTDRSLAREQLEAALVSDPRHAPSRHRLAAIAAGSDLKLDARRLLEEAVADDPTLDLARIALALDRAGSKLDRERALQILLAAPEAQRGPSLWSTIARSHFDLGDRRSATAAAERALGLDRRESASREILIQVALDTGRSEDAAQLLAEQAALDPQSIEVRARLARVLAGRGDAEGRARARAAVEDAVKTFPESTMLAALQAELALAAQDRPAALAALDRSLEIDPHLRDARRRRAALAGVSDELEDRFTVDAAALIDAPVSPAEQTWGAAHLLDRTVMRLYENGQSSRFVQTILRLQKGELRDLVRAEQIRYSPSREVVEVLSAERIRPTGEVIKASRTDDHGPRGKVSGMYVDQRWKSVEFDDLEAGDLIHVRYRIDSIGPNIFGGFFGDVAGIEGRFPKVRWEYAALAPESRPLYAGLLRAPPPKVSRDGDLVRTEWVLDDIAPIDPEPLLPPFSEIGSMVSVSTYSNWEDLGRWYAHLVRDSLELDDASREAGKKAVAGATSESEKIRRLYDYVVKNTRYVGIELGIHGWKPFKASEVHRRRYGDCKDKATLLAALLRDNGVDATLALVRTTDRGPVPPDHATMWAFDHAITYVPSADLYLDGTAEYSGSGELPWQDQGAFVLVVFPDGRIKLDSPPESAPAENLNRSSYRAELTPDGSLMLEGTESFFGTRAASTRQEFNEPRTRAQQVEKSLSQVAPGAEVGEVEFSDLSDLEKAPSYHYRARLPRYAQVAGARLILPLTLFPHQVANAYATVATRKYPLFAQHPWSTRNVIEYRLPPGTALESLPEGVNLDTPYVSLQQRVERTEHGFVTDDTVTLKAKLIPAADYPAFREACLAIDRALERKVVVRR
ncbi:MAG: DUF3857 domain-containing protein [Deltaproteobacteria bacterium]|nr:DUF3857 domain-containing protein [Deltaproteobacteria bacterium]